jgi:hypothetical protein
MYQSTSGVAFKKVRPSLGPRQKAVLGALRTLGNATNEEVSKFLRLPVNRITGRTKELRDMELVIEAGQRICKVTGSKVNAWTAVDQPVIRKEFDFPSKSTPGLQYRAVVTEKTAYCNCWPYRCQKNCKHIQEAQTVVKTVAMF